MGQPLPDPDYDVTMSPGLLPRVARTALVAAVAVTSARGAPLQCGGAKIVAPPGTGDFGTRLAASGEYAITGRLYNSSAANSNLPVSVFRRDGGAWILDASLSIGEGGGAFGASVAIDGSRALVGAPKWGTESAYVYRREDDGMWVQEAGLEPAGGGPGMLGFACALDGDFAVLAAEYDPPAYVFRRDDNGTPADANDDAWIEEAALTDGGFSVAIEGDTVVVGAIEEWTTGTPVVSDRIFVYRREPDGTWVLEATPGPAQPVMYFGHVVAIAGDFIAVGEPGLVGNGTVFLFRRDDAGTPSERSDDTWLEHAQLTTPTPSGFGASLCMVGDRLLVGSPGDGPGGLAYVFERDRNGTPLDPADDTWAPLHQLVPFDLADNDGFGSAVALTGDVALVGAQGANPPALYDFAVGGLCSDDAAVSLATGGAQRLELATGPSLGGSLYLVLGSTAPGLGILVDDVVLPLTIDAYLLYTLANPNSATLNGTLGALDTQGTSEATIAVPPGLSPGLAGLVLAHAYLAFDPTAGAIFASNAIELTLLP